MSKEEFEILLKSILDSNKGLTQEGIAIELEYNEGYISQMLSRGVISKKFVKQMINRFAKGKLNSTGLTESDKASLQIKFDAKLTVLLEAIAEVLAIQKNQTSAQVRTSLESALNEKEKNLRAVYGAN